ncbi:transglycosylase family protein [Streptomyces sp. NBC_01142]|uniref:transglycosylase family protein n=1 Tax=Streptomyces sp. NBC_01142 TaxID=2975865 RepID=UPI002253B850|nr:transglycosylase family protein [Streptomyces sp. NBC_01142]MCX4823630.1 transglycosylase family protein [Streptomyces sp. NBC_01142]
MRSGNGRHRRPRQAPALVVAAGVTGSAIAIPLLGATSASAADASMWDRVAECESGGMWSADLGNGYYGGLQFSQETWQSFGGTTYAPRADLASRSQQIAVAEKILAAQGPEAWPSCSPIAGLTDDGADTGVDPGGLPSDGQSTPAKPSAPAGSATPEKATEPSGSAEPSTEPSPAGSDTPKKATEPARPAESAAPDSAEAGTDAGSGKHRGGPAPEKVEPGNTDNERETGRHASRGDGPARDTAGVADVDPGEYTVRPGDSLWAIADEREVPGGWSAIYEANEQALGADPDLILPGQSLDLDLK